MIPTILQDVANIISKNPSSIKLSTHSNDGRVNSIESEKIIAKFIKNKTQYEIEIPPNRCWYDIKIGKFYCNIKISEMTNNDNTIGKAVIYYFLTGCKHAPNQYNKFFQSMCENENKNEKRDFYFIVVRKRDTKTFIISLKGLKEIAIAPNNPPFQCNWSKNIEPKQRNWKDAKKHLLERWAQSLKKRAEQQIKLMKQYYPNYFN